MTSLTTDRKLAFGRPSETPSTAWTLRDTHAILIAMSLAIASSWAIAVNLWSTGNFVDTDDALRMVQVRDLMAGQAWFDMKVHRLGMAGGLELHWSRIVDIPLVILTEFFRIFFSPVHAELATRHSFPVIMAAALLYALARAARSLMGPAAVLPSLAFCALSGMGVGQFQPGRIDHHAPQIALLMMMLTCTLNSMKTGKHRQAILSAIAAAVSLGISIENIPFVAIMSAGFLTLWINNPERSRKPLFAYSIGLLFALPAVFLLTVAPSNWLAPQCDAYSIAYLLPALIGAAVCAGLSGKYLCGSLRMRIGCAGLAVFASSVSLVVLFPQCLHGPLASVDPMLRKFWLDNVHEARPLLASLGEAPKYTVLLFAPAAICALFSFLAILKETGEKRRQWMVMSAFIVTGIATTIWQIRAGSSFVPLTALGGAWIVLQFSNHLHSRGIDTARVLGLSLVIPLSSTGWAFTQNVLPDRLFAGSATGTGTSGRDIAPNCFAAENFKHPARVSAGLVAGPIDIGAHMLAHTHHSSLAGAYHRNNRGNRLALDLLIAAPQSAEEIMRSSGANYVAICMGGAELDLLQAVAPSGLGASLAAGIVPPWLQEATPPGIHLRMYRLMPLTSP